MSFISPTPADFYNVFAAIQNQRKSPEDIQLTMRFLEQLFLQYLPEKAHILDLCCGTGCFLKELENRGYKTTGIDVVEALLNYARENAPNSQLLLEDARSFQLQPTFDGVFSQMSLNQILTVKELTSVFQNVYNALLENGLFVFNVFVEESYPYEKRIGEHAEIKDEYVRATIASTHPEERVVEYHTSLFRLIDGEWQRSNYIISNKHFTIAEIQSALKNVGFIEISYYDYEKDLTPSKERQPGVAFSSRKPLIR